MSTTPSRVESVARGAGTGARAWLRALELTATIAERPSRILPAVIDELAARDGEAPALLAERERLTFGALVAQSNRYARWALERGLAPGESVGLLMSNRPEYLAIWLGLTRVGVVVALLNTHLAGASLAHAIDVVTPRHVIVGAELLATLRGALPEVSVAPTVWVHGATQADFARLDEVLARYPGEALHGAERRTLTIEDPALYIYTSGTTGRPKAARVSHFRLMQWSHWFAGLLDVRPGDRMYDCLPLYHSVGGVVATGAALVGGGAVVVRETFSAREFWRDVSRWDCTLVQYIGELGRYLMHAEPTPHDTAHRVRIACGNGLRPDIWTDFQRRFAIPRILEFYAATEGAVSLFNVDGKVGAVGRIPPFLAHRVPTAIVRFDVEREAPVRDARGRGIRCGPDEVGEALGRLARDPLDAGARFEGYTSATASESKILRDVFEPGDAWFRTGDLMRKDAEGYVYFVDRIGDTFRFKGENVATSEVTSALTAFPGIKDATVYGVAVPGLDGRAGMATVAVAGALDLAALRTHLVRHLPDYARPRFLRVTGELGVTATFKHTKGDLVSQGFDPGADAAPLYFDDPERQAYVPLDADLYTRIQRGSVRVR